MGVWFTSDMHIGHKMVAGARKQGSYDNVDRDAITPEDVQWHDDMLAKKWDAVVKKDDVVWVVGDVTGGGQIPRGLAWIKDRPGTKHLVAGNHDQCHPMHRDSHRYQRQFMFDDEGKEIFASVQMAANRRIALDGGGHVNARISHFPFTEDHSPEARYTEWRLRDDGGYLIHGHTHSTKKTTGGREIHVGVDAWNFCPVNLEAIVSYINSQEEGE